MTTRRIALPVFSLVCTSGDAHTIEHALARVPGVRHVYVNPATEMAYVEYDPAECGPGQIIAAIESAGFRASEHLHAA